MMSYTAPILLSIGLLLFIGKLGFELVAIVILVLWIGVGIGQAVEGQSSDAS